MDKPVVRQGTLGLESFYDADDSTRRPPPPRLELSRAPPDTPPLSTPAPLPGSILTGKQEHYLKRELISQQTVWEINELNSPTALQRFGAPFRSDAGEVAPQDSDLPLLRHIFVNHVRNFPFLDRAREKEFWQDKLQIFLESFAKKQISGSEDRLEETKRRKLALKAQKLVELMMASGIPTASGYEERIRFSELEVVDRGANEQGIMFNQPEGTDINGWDINVAGVRTVSLKRTVRHHQHAEFLIRVKELEKPEIYVGRRYGDFQKLLKQLKLELPGKVFPPIPRKNKKHTGALIGTADDDSDSSISTQDASTDSSDIHESSLRAAFAGHRHTSSSSISGTNSPRKGSTADLHMPKRMSIGHHVLHREEQRVSLRAFIRSLLQNEQIATTTAMKEFLTLNPTNLTRDEQNDIARRKEMDERRIEEGRRFYEIARQRAAELDVHMERFRRDCVENGK